MPSILSHPAVPLALGLALGPRVIPRRLLLAGVVASILPDLDVLLARLSGRCGGRAATHRAARSNRASVPDARQGQRDELEVECRATANCGF